MSRDDDLLRECEAQCRALASGLLELERDATEETVVELFRLAHSLKGNCGMAGLEGAGDLAHAVEDVLSAVRAGRVEPTSDLVDGALTAVDGIDALLSGEEPAVDPEAAVRALRARLDRERDVDPDAGADDLDIPEPPADGDITVEEALERASVFDDLDGLVEGMEDAGEFENIEGSGTFDELEADGDPAATDAEVADAVDAFEAVKSEVEGDKDIGALERDLEEVQFGEFDEDDDMSIHDLIEMDAPTAGTAAEAADEGAEPSAHGETPAGETADALDDEDAADDETDDADDETGDGRAANESGVDADPAARTDLSSLEETDADVPEAVDGVEPADLDVGGDAPAIPGPGGIGDEVADAFESARDERMAEFEARFGDLFGGPGADGDAREFVRAAGTIEESRLDPEPFRSAVPETPAAPAVEAGRVHSLTVDVEVADTLLNLVEKLSMTRLRLEDAIEPADGDVEEALGDLRAVASEFRRTVMDVRLMPLSAAVDGLARVARDVARAQDKRVAFDVEGEDVKLDRSIIDRIGEPLVHVVRNAVDHGIEPPEEREEKGKPPEGRVELRAERGRDGVLVEVEDDGRGIDADRVLEAAVGEGVVTEAEAAAMDDEEARDLVFRAGLSTTEEVTDVSGRGVGMDIVERVVTDLDGSVEVESAPDAGTTVRLSLPVTVAVANVLFVESGGEQYGIPVTAVEGIAGADAAGAVDGAEAVRPPRDRHSAAENGGEDVDAGAGDADADADAAENGGGDGEARYPLVWLHEAFDVPGRPEGADGGKVVYVHPDAGGFAIHCDAVVETRETVVKPYEGVLGGVPGVSGATMLGDGDVVNIIDVTSIA